MSDHISSDFEFSIINADIADDYEDCAEEIIREFNEELKCDEIRYFGRTTRLKWETQRITVGTHIQRKGTIEEARVLEVTLTDKLLEKFNKNEKIKPLLRKYPFTRDMIELEIYFDDSSKQFDKTSEVPYVILANGSIFYKKYVKSGDLFYNILTETFDEALKKIESKNSAIVM